MARASLAVVTTLLVLVVLSISSADGSPWFDLFTNYRTRSSYYPQRRPQNPGSSRSGRDRFKAICRTINPDSYAFPGRAPFPAAPVCPY